MRPLTVQERKAVHEAVQKVFRQVVRDVHVSADQDLMRTVAQQMCLFLENNLCVCGRTRRACQAAHRLPPVGLSWKERRALIYRAVGGPALRPGYPGDPVKAVSLTQSMIWPDLKEKPGICFGWVAFKQCRPRAKCKKDYEGDRCPDCRKPFDSKKMPIVAKPWLFIPEYYETMFFWRHGQPFEHYYKQKGCYTVLGSIRVTAGSGNATASQIVHSLKVTHAKYLGNGKPDRKHCQCCPMDGHKKNSRHGLAPTCLRVRRGLVAPGAGVQRPQRSPPGVSEILAEVISVVMDLVRLHLKEHEVSELGKVFGNDWDRAIVDLLSGGNTWRQLLCKERFQRLEGIARKEAQEMLLKKGISEDYFDRWRKNFAAASGAEGVNNDADD